MPSISGATRSTLLGAAIAFAVLGDPRASSAQVTTGVIKGVVRDEGGLPVPAAEVVATNRATGVSTLGRSREDGRFILSGLELGGPYVVTARHIGYKEGARDSPVLTLGLSLRVDIEVTRQAVALQAVRTEADRNAFLARAAGASALVSDSAIHRLPTGDRDMYGFVRLVPQMSTWYGVSAAGTTPRMNLVMLDGTSEQGLNGGVPSGNVFGAKSISIEAIREYQVQLAPFDVQQGNFAGAVINGVTRSGTNELHGSAFYYGRYEALSRNVPFIRDARYEREQSGFSLGGPLIRNRAHFFVAAERQRFAFPAVGPYVGQGAAASTPLPSSADSIARFQQLLAAKGLDGGTAGPVVAENPLTNLFARVDVALPRVSSRVVIRENYGGGDSLSFSRPSPPPTPNCLTQACFALSSLARHSRVAKSGTVAQLYTTFTSGAYNELFAGYLVTITTIRPSVRAPLVLVRVTDARVEATLQSGTYELAQGDLTDNRSVELTDNFSLPPLGRHQLTIGGTAQFYWIRRRDVRGAYGVWQFPNLAAFAADSASSYRVTQNIGGADVVMPGAQFGAYAGDRWEPTPRLAFTYGLRADVPTFGRHPPYSDAVFRLFGKRTDVVPSGQVQWSPRAGFTLDVTGDRSTEVRGGVGAFTGRPPLFWFGNVFANYGQARTLTCNSAAAAPRFVTDYQNPPLVCRNGSTLTAANQGAVNLLDPHLRLPQNLRASLGIDHRLPWNVVATVEGMYTKALRELFFVNRNLGQPVSVDRHGRVMYGTLDTQGKSHPSAATTYAANVIDLTNQSKDYSYSFTGELRKPFTTNLEASAAFTYARMRDVQSQRLVRNPAIDNWRFGRVMAGRQDVTNVGTSDFDQPYRVVLVGTYRRPSRQLPTDVSLYYIGGSGFPFTYVAGGDQATGDLNADSTNVNDPIYIPRSASDSSEILLEGDSAATVARQASALDRFIDGARCLRRQRGHIMERNSCRTPWVSTTNLSVRQTLPALGAHHVAIELQVFNLLNLLNGRWGRVALPSQVNTVISQVNLLTQVPTGSSRTEPKFKFDPATRRFDSRNVDSYYQIQLSARYSF